MKSIAERLAEQQEASKEFAKRNFGAMMGDGYPELVREILANKTLTNAMGIHFMISVLRTSSIMDKLKPNSGSFDSLIKEPAVYEQPTQWLYWGIEIGRQLQREEAAAEVGAR